MAGGLVAAAAVKAVAGGMDVGSFAASFASRLEYVSECSLTLYTTSRMYPLSLLLLLLWRSLVLRLRLRLRLRPSRRLLRRRLVRLRLRLRWGLLR